MPLDTVTARSIKFLEDYAVVLYFVFKQLHVWNHTWFYMVEITCGCTWLKSHVVVHGWNHNDNKGRFIYCPMYLTVQQCLFCFIPLIQCLARVFRSLELIYIFLCYKVGLKLIKLYFFCQQSTQNTLMSKWNKKME